ncbi:hypothetical protein J3E68DRAFT_404602 [Trichoderma sp. SZMC 28012]
MILPNHQAENTGSKKSPTARTQEPPSPLFSPQPFLEPPTSCLGCHRQLTNNQNRDRSSGIITTPGSPLIPCSRDLQNHTIRTIRAAKAICNATWPAPCLRPCALAFLFAGICDVKPRQLGNSPSGVTFFFLFFFFFSSCCPFGLPFSHGVCQCWQFMIDATTAGPTVRVAFWANA